MKNKKINKTKNQVIVVPTGKKTTPKTKSAKKTKPSSVDYFNCLLTSAQQNWLDPVTKQKKKITACCKDCRLNAPTLASQRNQEVQKLVGAYKQVGDSLTKLLQPIK